MFNPLAWTYSGVDFNKTNLGGEACAEYLNKGVVYFETIFYTCYSLLVIHIGFRRSKLLQIAPGLSSTPSRAVTCGRWFLFFLFFVVFGAEIFFKIYTGEFVWIVFPCHVVTTVQLILLALPPSGNHGND